MKKVTGILKKTKYYHVTFDDEPVQIEPEIFLKYHLKIQQDIDDQLYHQIIDDNFYEYYYKLGIVRLKRMQSAFELRQYLLSKGAKEGLVKQLIHKFTERKYLDDFIYAKNYLNLKSMSDGPHLIVQKLKDKGISTTIIDQVFKTYDEHAILDVLLPKKMKTIKNKSKKQAIQVLKMHFIRKGFDLGNIEHHVKKALVFYAGDEQKIMHKAYQKLYKKYKDKTDKNALSYTLTQKLYAKGFKMEDIKKIIDQSDHES